MEVVTVATKPIPGQKPGTSGLRKRTCVFQQPHYLENFLQCVFDSLPSSELKGSTLVVGGDGRYHMDVALQTVFKIAAAAGVSRILVGKDGLFNTPAISATIRKRGLYGGVIFTASHNSGGKDGDFGVKYNCSNGGPAPSSVTNTIFDLTQSIQEYSLAKLPEIDITQVGEAYSEHGFTVEVIDPVGDYLELLESVFDFAAIRVLLERPEFNLLVDCLHAVNGIYARRIFGTELGAKSDAFINDTPLPDFGGGHPDPNLVHATDLVRACSDGEPKQINLGIAFDGDGDRNMIMATGAFVTPSDSLAIIAANSKTIPFFVEAPLPGVARSMPTSAAIDRVAKALNLPCFEVPTGWKYFGNLMDSGQIALCGEESFGTGSSHVREKDGIWAALAWLSILADRNRELRPGNPLVTIADIQKEHWSKYGRNYFVRYDYEDVDNGSADAVMNTVADAVKAFNQGGGLAGQRLGVEPTIYQVESADQYEFHDAVDGSVALLNEYRFIFRDDSRIIFRKSGTAATGSTIRLYVDRPEPLADRQGEEATDACGELIKIALNVSNLEAITGRTGPTVIT